MPRRRTDQTPAERAYWRAVDAISKHIDTCVLDCTWRHLPCKASAVIQQRFERASEALEMERRAQMVAPEVT